jgi:16S rRNA (guanine966-N2)-methyltransferase
VREAVFDVLEDLVRRARTAALGEPAASGPGEPAAAEPGPVAGPLAGRRVLDLFAGSGALGIEALSRGAAHCTFVERDRPALHALRANLAAVGVEVLRRRVEAASPLPPVPTARIAAVDARRALVADARGGEMYTLVLVDPPYARYGELEGDLARLLAPLLAPGALVVLETHCDQALRLPWRLERVKRYGDTQVAFMAPDEE